VFVQDGRCTSCHREGGAGDPIARLKAVRDPEWVRAHVRDPEVLVPGSRTPPEGAMSLAQAHAVVVYMRRIRGGSGPMPPPGADGPVAMLLGRYCASCHMIDGEGASSAPDLSRAGRTRDEAWLRRWITDPAAIDPAASMPAFGEALTEDEVGALARYLAARK
jgi:mono/diheme cytochrome c family protein